MISSQPAEIRHALSDSHSSHVDSGSAFTPRLEAPSHSPAVPPTAVDLTVYPERIALNSAAIGKGSWCRSGSRRRHPHARRFGKAPYARVMQVPGGGPADMEQCTRTAGRRDESELHVEFEGLRRDSSGRSDRVGRQ